MNDVFVARVKCNGFSRVESDEAGATLLRDDIGMG